jgi:glycine C-acetyltransferase
MFASYNYLGLLGHPKINEAARTTVEHYGTGTHGAGISAGTMPIHVELEKKIANFVHRDAAVVFTSGYVTNLTTISSLVGRHDIVISDKLNHASIVDGCILSGAKFMRFEHNDMADLECCLQKAGDATKLVVVDAVFSMDGDIINLPQIKRLCQEYNSWLMVDEAHSLGVLGDHGRGIEEHFGIDNIIDVKMGTLSKAIPSIGGYITGSQELISYLKHSTRAHIFSGSLPPAQASVAIAALNVIETEPWRLIALRRNVKHFLKGLREQGLNTMNSETPIVPILSSDDEKAWQMAKLCQDEGIFVLPVVSPAVPKGLARLRATVTVAHTQEDIDHAIDIFAWAGNKVDLPKLSDPQ